MRGVKGKGDGRAPNIAPPRHSEGSLDNTKKATQKNAMKNLSRFTRWIVLARILGGLVRVSKHTVGS
jgi:hypothetical protein